MRRVDVVITNPRHHLAMFGPVIRRLVAAHRLAVRVVSLCELRGYRTPIGEVTSLGASCLPIVAVRLAKESSGVQQVRQRSGGAMRRALQSLTWNALVRWNAVAGAAPYLAVLPNDTAFPYNRIVARLAAAGIPFVLLQEGIRFELPAAREGARYGQGGAQAVGAWGPSSARYFEDVGVPAERIHVVGNPRLDAIVETDWEPQAVALRRDHALGARVVLYLSNPVDAQGFCTTDDKHRLFGRFLDGAAAWLDRTDTLLVVKIHPAESLQAYRGVAAASPCAARTRVIRDAELYPLLTLAAGAVVLATTAGLEALLFGVPLGALEVPGAGYLFDFVQRGAAVPLRADETLGAGLAELVDHRARWDGARRAYLADHIANVGRAADATADLLLARLRPLQVASR